MYLLRKSLLDILVIFNSVKNKRKRHKVTQRVFSLKQILSLEAENVRSVQNCVFLLYLVKSDDSFDITTTTTFHNFCSISSKPKRDKIMGANYLSSNSAPFFKVR